MDLTLLWVQEPVGFDALQGLGVVIHQTFRSRELRPELPASIADMQRRNPDWEYRFYDDADITRYVVDKFGADFGDYLDVINPK